MSRCRPLHLAPVPATRLFLVVAVAVAWVALAPAADASASREQVRCGDTITRDTKLKNDLVDCPGNGIVIGADDIELDLNGHTIDGDGVLGCTEFYACDFGVDNTAGHHGVTVGGGTIRDFATAIFVLGANDNRLHRLSSTHNVLGGVLVIASPGTRIEHNSISANGLTTDQAGLIVFDSSEIRIEKNSVSDNGDIGMFLIGLGDTRIEGNSVSGNPEAGVILEGDGNEVSRNRVAENGDAIVVTGDANSVTRNDVVDVLGFPDEPGSGFGILVDGGSDNLVQGNDVRDVAGLGIRVTAFDPDATGFAQGNVVRDNRVARAGVDGILVDETATGSLLKLNRASGADDDGIDVESPTTTLTRNTANRNGDLGIEAVTGVTDGGGNRAHGNGNPLQCTNVFCT
jgi:parallel beta-helix repeat protein